MDDDLIGAVTDGVVSYLKDCFSIKPMGKVTNFNVLTKDKKNPLGHSLQTYLKPAYISS